MNYEKYLREENQVIPEDMRAQIQMNGTATPLALPQVNRLLQEKNLQYEAGYVQLADGTYLVAMYCPMPGVTKEMIGWWFWWHPQENKRYRLWYPGEHYKNSYGKKDKSYFTAESQPSFQENTQYPIEKIGNIKMPLSISFVSPRNFGFNEELIEKSGVGTIVCGHVGAFYGIIQHTEMAHIYFETKDGLYMVSRFWLGARCKNNLLKKLMITEDAAKGMAEHCCIEYRNLADKLPRLYREFGDNIL